MEDRSFVLESGKTVLVTPLRLSVLDEQGESMAVRQMLSISRVTRDEESVSIKARRQPTLQITMRSVADAQELEASVAEARALLPTDAVDTADDDTGRQLWGLGHPFTVVGYVCAALVMLGSIGPWVTNADGAASGTSGDGVLTLLLGVVATAFLFLHERTAAAKRRVLRVSAALAFLASAFVGGNIMNTIWTSDEEIIVVSVGWGLWIVVLASIVGAGVVMVKPRTT